MVESAILVRPGTFSTYAPRRRPSFPQGGLDWHLKRRNSTQRSGRGLSATMTELANDEDSNECTQTECSCKDNENTATLLVTDDNQNSPKDVDVKEKSSVKTCLNVNCVNYQKPKRRFRRGGRSKATVIINVGGHIFETYKYTLKKMKNSVLADEKKMHKFYRPESGDYFFDRDPQAFASVLNYLRTGELHIPPNMCGPSLENELTFWGIDELDIERCCWTQYNTWKTQCRSLAKLEYDRKLSTTQDSVYDKNNTSFWQKCRAKLWTFLQDPTSSKGAKIYAWISIIFVLTSIFSFCAETHPQFRVKTEDITEFKSVYQFLNLEVIEWASDDKTGSDTVLQNGTGNTSSHQTEADGDAVKTLPHPSLLIMDLTCLIFFTLEYLSRFLCSPSKKKFLMALQNVIDFVAIIPDYIEFLFLFLDPGRREGMVIMDFMIILRMLRLCRIFRLIRHVPGLWILLYTLKASFNELMLMFVFLLIGMVVFASLIHFAEGENGFNNIPVGFWWSVVTMTTVGYGDMYPKSAFGYVIGSFCAIAGLLMIAFTVPIIVSNFVLYYTHVQYGLARRDRDIERMREHAATEDGDSTSQQTRISVKITKPHPDNSAIELGENIALTTSNVKSSEEQET